MSSSKIPVKGCCALTQRLSLSLHSKSAKPVIQANSHLRAVDQIELVAEIEAKLAARRSREVSVCANLIFGRGRDDQVARIRAERFCEFLQPVRAEILFERRADSFGRDFDGINAACSR